MPALVLHGPNDPLVPIEHGRDTARAIPAARLLEIDGLGHGIAYPQLWAAIVDAISRRTREAQAA